MSTLKTHNLQSPDAGSVNIVMAPNAGMVVAGLSTYSNQINVGSNIKLGTAGVITATSFVGSGVNLTGIALTSLNVNGNTNNNLITATGNQYAVQGEAGLTYDGSQLIVRGSDTVTSSGGTKTVALRGGDANDEKVNLSFETGAGGPIAVISGIADATGVYPNTTGSLSFNTQVGGGVFERLRITSSGYLKHTGLRIGNSQNKLAILTTPSYNTSEEDVALYIAENESGMNQITFGGGTSAYNAATAIRFLTASAVNTTTGTERLRIDSSGRVVVGGSSAYIGGAALAVLGTGTTPNTYGSFAIGKVGANPTAGTTLANIRLNGGSIGTRRGAEINAVANSNWSDGSSHPTKLTFAVANVNSASATQRFEINHYGHMVFTNENALPASGSPGTNGFKGLTQLGYQHWGHRQYYSGQQNLTQNQYFNLFSNNTAHDDIIFWLNIKGYHGNRTFATAHGAIGGYGLSVSYQSSSGVYGSFSGVNIGTGREQLRWTSTSPYAANWWIWGWYSGTTGTGTHTGWSAAQLH